MATPSLTKHVVPGRLGPLLIDVRAAGRTTPRPAVIVLHGFKGFKDWGMFPVLAERLATAGFAVVSPNLSGSGVDDAGDFAFPERFGHATFSADLADFTAVLDALSAGDLGVAPPPTVGLVGHSRGGGTAVLATAADQRIGALVTWAAISTVERFGPEDVARWRAGQAVDVVNSRTGQVLPLYRDFLDDIERHREALDIPTAAGRIAVPWLLAQGSADPAVPPAEADVLAAAGGGKPLERLTVPGGGHTFGAVHPWAGSTPEFDLVSETTVRWLSRYL